MKESAPEHTFKGNLSVLDVVMITRVRRDAGQFDLRHRAAGDRQRRQRRLSVVSDRRLRRRRHRAVLCRARRRTPQRRRRIQHHQAPVRHPMRVADLPVYPQRLAVRAGGAGHRRSALPEYRAGHPIRRLDRRHAHRAGRRYLRHFQHQGQRPADRRLSGGGSGGAGADRLARLQPPRIKARRSSPRR
ncbi:Uncharacterised protein [Serratia marcescens]|uniref:Uncharacterized protein n=1 Tax=Serratia marcescens TaxID=615 RepID=A0A379Y2H7_SERMA|nr:Uncharacterised protein [Serratia marcescens]